VARPERLELPTLWFEAIESSGSKNSNLFVWFSHTKKAMPLFFFLNARKMHEKLDWNASASDPGF
jgi:hypothetical protein